MQWLKHSLGPKSHSARCQMAASPTQLEFEIRPPVGKYSAQAATCSLPSLYIAKAQACLGRKCDKRRVTKHFSHNLLFFVSKASIRTRIEVATETWGVWK